MAATLKQIRDKVILDRPKLIGNIDFPEARLTKEINLAQRYVQSEIAGIGFYKWQTSYAVTAGLTAGTHAGYNIKTVAINVTYFPNMLETPKSIRYFDIDDGTTKGIAKEVAEEHLQEKLGNTFGAPTLKQGAFARIDNSVILAPSTITAATAHYYKIVADLSGDTDITEIPTEFESFVIKKVLIEVDDIMGDLSNKASAVQQLANEIQATYQGIANRMNATSQKKNESHLQ